MVSAMEAGMMAQAPMQADAPPSPMSGCGDCGHDAMPLNPCVLAGVILPANLAAEIVLIAPPAHEPSVQVLPFRTGRTLAP